MAHIFPPRPGVELKDCLNIAEQLLVEELGNRKENEDQLVSKDS